MPFLIQWEHDLGKTVRTNSLILLHMTYAGVFNLWSFDRSLPSGRPLYSFSISSVYHNTDDCLILVTRKLPITRWPSLLIHVRSRYKEKSLGLTILFNIGALGIGRNRRWSSGQAGLTVQCFLKIGPLDNLETQEQQDGRYGELYLRKRRRAAWEDVSV
jgi:hypothetical protein